MVLILVDGPDNHQYKDKKLNPLNEITDISNILKMTL